MTRNVVIIDRERLKEALRPKSMLELWPEANHIVQVVRKAPGITLRQLCTYFGWKRSTKERMLHRLVQEEYLASKLVLVTGRNGKKSRTRAYWPGKRVA